MIKLFSSFITIVFFSFPQILVAQDDQNQSEVPHVTLEELREKIVSQDFSILSSEFGLKQSEHSYFSTLGVFDPTYIQDVIETESRSHAQSSSLLLLGRRHARTMTRTSTSTLSKLWSSGTITSLGYTLGHTKVNDPTVTPDPLRTSTLTFGITQPLLKGFGFESNLSAALQAKENWNSAIKDHQRLLHIRFQALEVAYWTWILAMQTEQVRVRSVERADDDYQYNVNAHESGKFARTEVLEAETRLLERQADLLEAKQVSLDALDDLRIIVGWNDFPQSVLSDQTIPSISALKLPGESELIQHAQSQRRDLKALHHLYQAIKYKHSKAKKDQLPELDFAFDLQYDGEGSNHGSAFRDLERNDDWNWTASLNLTYPLGNREAKNTYLSAKYELRQLEVQIAELKALIALEIRQNLRSVITQQKVVETRIKAVESAKATLEAETQKHRLGRISTLTLAQVQERSDDAELALLQAYLDSWLALVDIRVSLGFMPHEKIVLGDES